MTHRNQVCMPINGRGRCIDRCVHHIVAALNVGGVRTMASCCGHKKQAGLISLEDSRHLAVFAGDPNELMKKLGSLSDDHLV